MMVFAKLDFNWLESIQISPLIVVFLNSLSNFTSLSISNSRSTQYNRCGLDACQFMGISYSVPLLERCYLSQGVHWITVEINHRQGSWEIPWCKCSYFWSTWLVHCWIQFICSFIFQINLAYSFKYTLLSYQILSLSWQYDAIFSSSLGYNSYSLIQLKLSLNAGILHK